jgi:hypothetical protein
VWMNLIDLAATPLHVVVAEVVRHATARAWASTHGAGRPDAGIRRGGRGRGAAPPGGRRPPARGRRRGASGNRPCACGPPSSHRARSAVADVEQWPAATPVEPHAWRSSVRGVARFDRAGGRRARCHLR